MISAKCGQTYKIDHGGTKTILGTVCGLCTHLQEKSK